MENVRMYKIEKDEMKRRIAREFDISSEKVTDELLESIQEFVKTKSSGGEYWEERIEMASIPPGTFPPGTKFCLIPETYCFVNIKRTTWVLIGLLLDILIAQGVASAFLNSLGIIGKCVAKLDPKNGEICVYYESLLLKKDGIGKFEDNEVLSRISQKDCKYPKLNCEYNDNGTCSLQLKYLQEILDSLKEKSVFSRTEANKWRVEL